MALPCTPGGPQTGAGGAAAPPRAPEVGTTGAACHYASSSDDARAVCRRTQTAGHSLPEISSVVTQRGRVSLTYPRTHISAASCCVCASVSQGSPCSCTCLIYSHATDTRMCPGGSVRKLTRHDRTGRTNVPILRDHPRVLRGAYGAQPSSSARRYIRTTGRVSLAGICTTPPQQLPLPHLRITDKNKSREMQDSGNTRHLLLPAYRRHSCSHLS